MPAEAGLRVGIAGGGTGGHIEPALNLADEFRRRDPSMHITVFGTEKGLETTLVPARGYELTLIPPVPLPRKLSKDLFSIPKRLRAANAAAAAILVEHELDVAVGFGGYVSIPVYLAARKVKIPFVVHEANARAGLANRLGARFTPFVAENFEGSIKGAVRLGCPLREAITELDRASARNQGREAFELDPEGPVLLVFGGSQGAASINRAVLDAVGPLTDAGVQILHAVGPNQKSDDARIPGYHPVPFIERMDLAYAAADLAVCRSGAMTCAELAAVGLPAVYVPYPIGNGEQRFNALPVVRAGGGLIVDDADLTGGVLTDTVMPMLTNLKRLQSMSDRAGAYGIRDGAARLADLAVTAAGDRR